ncbi:Type VII secretion protein EccC OS=Streptomyces fumanus OX=67302 GN=GCM10018772_70890 PE=4 SV=1 [Streptomyces fumanus]
MRLVEGAAAVVVVDDYDLIGGSPMNQPFAPLLDDVVIGWELGVHLIVARAAAGSVRGLNDPLLRRLQEVNTPGVLLSCPPSEGYVFGNVKGRNLAAGRGRRIARRKTVEIQTAWVDGPGAESRD